MTKIRHQHVYVVWVLWMFIAAYVVRWFIVHSIYRHQRSSCVIFCTVCRPNLDRFLPWPPYKELLALPSGHEWHRPNCSSDGLSIWYQLYFAYAAHGRSIFCTSHVLHEVLLSECKWIRFLDSFILALLELFQHLPFFWLLCFSISFSLLFPPAPAYPLLHAALIYPALEVLKVIDLTLHQPSSCLRFTWWYPRWNLNLPWACHSSRQRHRICHLPSSRWSLDY